MNRVGPAGRTPPAADTARFEVCEPRLALSANPAADALLDVFAFDDDSADADAAVDLWQQARDLHSAYGLTGQGQTVAVIDSGIAYDHIALGGGYGPGYRVVGGWDFAEDDPDPYDDGPAGFHGSHVAGILAGQNDDFTGLAPDADLVGLRVFDDQGGGQLAWVESALQWVHDHRDAFAHPITTVNLSLGALLPDELAADVLGQLEDELRALHDAGISVFAAAGNRFDPAAPDQLNYPASSDFVTAVASADEASGLSRFSQRQNGILAAAGEGIVSTVPEHVLGWDGVFDDLAPASGTSMATPQAAAASLLVRQAFEQAGREISLETIHQHLLETADRLTDPATGVDFYRINLLRAADTLLAPDSQPEAGPETPDDPVTEPPPTPGDRPIDLGAIELTETELTNDRWHTTTASRDGLLSFRSITDGENTSQPQLRILRADGSTAWDGEAADQIDLPVAAGESLQVFVRGDAPVARFTIGNLAALGDDHFQVVGTSQGDRATVDLADGVRVDIGGLHYAFPDGRLATVDIDLGSGSDRVDITGSERGERVTLRPSTAEIARPGLTVTVDRTETLAFAGGGGADRAYLYDSPADDSLVLRPTSAELSGTGFARSVADVGRIYVHATAGGDDSAFLYDSADDDRLAIRPQFTSIRSGDFFNSAVGFDRVYAYATAGGFDAADLHDSAGDDRMTANHNAAWISGRGYFAHARHFDSVTAHATAGGMDLATLYAENAEDRWRQTSDQVRLESADGASQRSARGFERVEAYESGAAVPLSPLAIEHPSRPNAPAHDTHVASREPAHPADLRAAQLLWVVEKSQPTKEAPDPAWLNPHATRQTERHAFDQIFAELDDEP